MKCTLLARLSSPSLARVMGFAAALALGVLGGSPSSSAAVLVATDSSWKITAGAPGASDWNSNAAFDDSSWESATELGAWPTASPAQVIWSSGGQFSTTETQVWARRVFSLGALPLSAMLNGGFDDDGDVYINGVLVVSNQNGFADNFPTMDITSYLTTGLNLIAFMATDNYRVWGYNHGAALQIDGTFRTVSAPGTFALLGLGLAGLGLIRRRRA